MVPGKLIIDKKKRFYEVYDEIYKHSDRKSKEADQKLKHLVIEGRFLNSDLEIVQKIFDEDISYRA